MEPHILRDKKSVIWCLFIVISLSRYINIVKKKKIIAVSLSTQGIFFWTCVPLASPHLLGFVNYCFNLQLSFSWHQQNNKSSVKHILTDLFSTICILPNSGKHTGFRVNVWHASFLVVLSPLFCIYYFWKCWFIGAQLATNSNKKLSSQGEFFPIYNHWNPCSFTVFRLYLKLEDH